MWEAKSEVIDVNIQKISLMEDKASLSYQEVIEHWRENEDFRNFYFSLLSKSLFEAFFWENPPITKATLTQNYEFVLVNSLQLAGVNADPSPFQGKFKAASLNQNVITFENLGRDAELIVPCLLVEKLIYAHLAVFIRNAPDNQKHDLFVTLANSLKHRISNSPTWVSTSGLGVYWLHIRLDTKPKYYSYQLYRNYTGE